MSEIEGNCLCGGINVRIPASTHDVGVCHCEGCRRWGSGPWMSLQIPDAIISGNTLTVFRSSALAERAFCFVCGTHIFHRPQDGPELAVASGLFPSQQMYIAREIFVDAKPPFYCFVADSEKRSTFGMALEWLPKLIWRRVKRAFKKR